MRSNFMLGLAASAFGMGLAIAGASAAPADWSGAAQARSGWSPIEAFGKVNGGLAAIRSRASSSLKESPAAEPPHKDPAAWRGLVGGAKGDLAALTAASAAGPKEGAALQAMASSPAAAAGAKGFSALKAAAGPSNAQPIEVPGVAPSVTGRVELLRPESGTWSDTGRAGLRATPGK